MKKQLSPFILNVKNYVPGKPIEEVERELGIKSVIKLASNENCFGPSPRAIEAVRKSLRSANRYPDGSNFRLRNKLSGIFGIGSERFIFGNGSDEVICLAMRTFVGAGDEVVIARPTFLVYEISAQLHGANIKYVPLTRDLKYDLKKMSEAVTAATKIVFIANPDNPTGTYVTKKDLEAFIASVPKNVIIFLDEAYFEFAAHSFTDYPDGMDYLDRPNVIVARSFSKVYGLAGFRIGYGVSSAELIGYMERAREPFNVNLLAQTAALAALDDGLFLKKTLSHVEMEREFLYAAFRKMGLKYVRSATNFVMVDVVKDCKEVFSALLKQGVIVRDMKAWGFDTFIRVTVGTKSENRKFVAALKGVLK